MIDPAGDDLINDPYGDDVIVDISGDDSMIVFEEPVECVAGDLFLGSAVLSFSGHSDDTYNGDYNLGACWNGFPHYVNGNGRHFYYLVNGDEGDFTDDYWQLDYTS